jgi:micrococcal nuclease
MFDSFYNTIKVLLFSAILSFYQITGVPNPFQTDPFFKENTVVEVVDGDTIDVFLEGQIQRVRLIGVNTPETVDKRRGVECFGPEASSFLKNTLTGKQVILENDETQGDKDAFKRLLRYVFLDNQNLNQKIIYEGYGFEYTYKKPYKYQKEFREAQRDARDNYKGLWNQDNCRY